MLYFHWFELFIILVLVTTIEFSSALYTITEGGSVSLVFTVLGPLNISIPIIITTTPGSADGMAVYVFTMLYQNTIVPL